MAKGPHVLILMGSDSDLPIMSEAAKALAEFDISCELHIASAHRTPEKVHALVHGAAERGMKAIICGAGFAAHLAGVVASLTILPVIGVPLESSSLQGLDALLSTVQMPSGIPVAAMTIGTAGAKNAGIFVAEMLAINDAGLREKLVQFRQKMAEQIEDKDAHI